VLHDITSSPLLPVFASFSFSFSFSRNCRRRCRRRRAPIVFVPGWVSLTQQSSSRRPPKECERLESSDCRLRREPRPASRARRSDPRIAPNIRLLQVSTRRATLSSGGPERGLAAARTVGRKVIELTKGDLPRGREITTEEDASPQFQFLSICLRLVTASFRQTPPRGGPLALRYHFTSIRLRRGLSPPSKSDMLGAQRNGAPYGAP